MSQTTRMASDEEVAKIGEILTNSACPLAERFRSMFTLKNLKGNQAIHYISLVLLNDNESPLIKHEAAYCLGQIGSSVANDVLIKSLANKLEHPMVRHESGEALGAIGSPEVLPIVEKYINDDVIEVSQTCELAASRIKWLQSNEDKSLGDNPFNTIDPAPAVKQKIDVKTLFDQLIDDKSSLYSRYEAMFTLRNIGSKESIKALNESLITCNDDKSALFRHEIAYVLGQLAHVDSIPYLERILLNNEENEMVRHECAEALGSIDSDEAAKVLDKFKDDPVQIVRESVEVALDINSSTSTEFQYANTLEKIKCSA